MEVKNKEAVQIGQIEEASPYQKLIPSITRTLDINVELNIGFQTDHGILFQFNDEIIRSVVEGVRSRVLNKANAIIGALVRDEFKNPELIEGDLDIRGLELSDLAQSLSPLISLD